MEPPDKSNNPPPPPGLPGLPMFGQNFSSHFLSGLQNFASQELVNKLQKMSQNAAQYGDFNEGEEDKHDESGEKEEEEMENSVAFEPEVKVYTDELANMCEYTCQICGKIMNAYYLRKHVRDHNMSMTTYKELYGKVQFSKLSFHRCRICQNVIKANYITIMKHLKCVHNVTFKDYKRKFSIFLGKKESKQMFKETAEGDMELETDRIYSDKSSEMCKVACKECNTDYPTHQFRFHVKSKHQMTFDEYRDKNGTLEIHNRVYHRCKVCFKVLLFQYEKLASHVTDSHGLKMSAYVRLYLERPVRLTKPSRKAKDKSGKKKSKSKTRKVLPKENVSAERPRTRGKVKEEEGGVQNRFEIKRELEEILMNQEIGEVDDSEEDTRKSRRKKPRRKITRLRRRPKEEMDPFSIKDIKEEVADSDTVGMSENFDSTMTVKQETAVDDDEGGPANETNEDNAASTESKADNEEGKTDDNTEEQMDTNDGNETEAAKKESENDEKSAEEKATENSDAANGQQSTTNEVVKKEVKPLEMVFSDNPEEMCLCQCSFCDKVVPYDLLRKHVNTKHGKVKDDYGEYKYIRLTYHRCKKCNLEILFSYNNIKLHLNRFHKMSIVEYQQSIKGFSGKVINLRTLKAMYEEEDSVREVKRAKISSDRPTLTRERNYGALVNPPPDRQPTPRFEPPITTERKPRRDYDERNWYDGNTFSCKDDCGFSSCSLDRFEEHLRMDHRATLDTYKGRYSNTNVSLQCEYCGEHVYHELRSIQHHLDSHYLTLEQYQAHYLRNKVEEPLPLSSSVEPEIPQSKPPNEPPLSHRMEQSHIPDTQSLNQAFSETSTLLDHLKRSELFRTSSEKPEEYQDNYRSQDNFRTNDTISFQTSQDHFRPFDDQEPAATAVRTEPEAYKSVPRTEYEQDFVRTLTTGGMDVDRDQFASSRTFPAPGLPIDYSQHVPQRETFQPKQQQPPPPPTAYKDDIYGSKPESFSPKESSYSPRLDNYPAKHDIFAGKPDGYLPKPDLFTSREENYSPKPEYPAKPADPFAGKAMDKFAEDQKLNQENYFRYVTSQLHEYYNRRQGAGSSESFERESPRNPDTFQQNYGRQEPFPQGILPRADVYGYRRENF